MPDDFVRVTPRENVLGNQDSGDLTMVHFARHTFWAEHDEAEAAEEEQFASLYPHLAAVAVEPSRGPRRRNQKGQFCSTSRWPDDFVREVRPDSDELVHLGLTSDEDEFGGRALKGAALLR
jgi:hypothetical protein